MDASLKHKLTLQKNLVQYRAQYAECMRHFQYPPPILKFCFLIGLPLTKVYGFYPLSRINGLT